MRREVREGAGGGCLFEGMLVAGGRAGSLLRWDGMGWVVAIVEYVWRVHEWKVVDSSLLLTRWKGPNNVASFWRVKQQS